jgi:hypothetical protein
VTAISVLSTGVASAIGARSPVVVAATQPTTANDDLSYSYYYVPRLSDLHHRLGELVREHRIASPANGHLVWYERLIAYGCDTVLRISGSSDTVDIDWTEVTAVGVDPHARQPTVFIRGGTAGHPSSSRPGTQSTFMFVTVDLATRDALAYGLTALMNACPSQQTQL